MKKEGKLFIGLRYHYNTETFDRINAHGISPSGNSAIPIDRGKSTRNALLALDDAVKEGSLRGYSKEEVIEIIRDTARYDYGEICKILGESYFPLNE